MTKEFPIKCKPDGRWYYEYIGNGDKERENRYRNERVCWHDTRPLDEHGKCWECGDEHSLCSIGASEDGDVAIHCHECGYYE